MKKIAVFLILMIAFSFVGCDFFGLTTTEVTTKITTSHVTANSSASTYTGIANVDDVDYETLFDDSVYKKFILYFSEENFLKLIDDMENYNDQWGNYRDNTIQEVDMTYIDGEGNVLEVHEVGFRTKGNIFSRVLPVIKAGDEIIGYQQVSFQLEFNATFEYQEGSTEYTSLKSREVFDLEQLNFKRVRDDDYAIVTESFAYDVFRDAGVVTSNTSFAIIYFNIEGTIVPYGLFMLQEPIDDVFVERYFGKNNDDTIGDLYKCTWQTEPASLKDNYQSYSLGVSDYNEGFRRSYALKTNKYTSDHSQFLDFIDIVNETTVIDYYGLVAGTLVMDDFAKAMALNFLIGSADDFRSNANNYYMYFNNGHAYYIPFDYDNSLGFGWNPYEDYGISLDIDSVQPSNYDWYGHVSDFVLIYNLMHEQDFLDLYLNYLDIYTSEGSPFNYEDFEDQFYMVKDLYKYEIWQEGHLGVSHFTLTDRQMQASLYFSEKIAEVRDQIEDLG